MSSIFSRLREKLISWLFKKLHITEALDDIKHPKVYRASCWAGTHAEARMMNMLSPRMSEQTFQAHLKWMKNRGCNTAHVILINQHDGEASGYSPWGVGVAPKAIPCDGQTVLLMRTRILALRRSGFCVVPWIITDDSKQWARELFVAPRSCVQYMVDAGLIELDAPLVVLGLEMNEYGTQMQWMAVRDALRIAGYHGDIGTHHTSGDSIPFAGLGQVVLAQLAPSCDHARIQKQVQHFIACGNKVIGFEYSRHEDRAKAQAALDAGAIGCGNW